MKKSLIRLAATLAAFFIVVSLGGTARAWQQFPHIEINNEAIFRFHEDYGNKQKYKNAPFSDNALCTAPQVSVSGLFSASYYQNWTMDGAAAQIGLGGFSADEPNVYVSMKHFYDPLALSGKHELTDQEYAHGWTYDAIPANRWALEDTSNPYSLINAMLNLKKSMEIASDAAVEPIPALGDFRDLAGSPASVDEMRSMYLGKSMRGIGEVMHLISDMTQPAHVRNDSHPVYEITETAVSDAVAAVAVRDSRLDGLAAENFGQSINDIFIALSTFTNANFYSEDTIYDKGNVSPNNGEVPNPHPVFADLKREKAGDGYMFYRLFGGRKIPMLREYSGWLGTKYEIPPEYAVQQATVLLPLAVYAGELTIDRFLPTLTLGLEISQTEADTAMLARAKSQGAETLKQYSADIKLTHDVAKDYEWQKAGLEIKYSGPGQIWRMRGGKSVKLCDIEFKDGVVTKYQDADTGKMVEGNPQFYLPLGADRKVSLAGKAIDYTVELEDALYVVVNTGARMMQSTSYVFQQDEAKIKLTAAANRAMPGDKVSFAAEVTNAPEQYSIEWSFGDDTNAIVNRKTKMEHAYQKEDEFTATVRLIDKKRNVCIAEDSANISVYLGDFAGPWQINLSVDKESKVFMDMIKALMKGLIKYIISPVVQAMGGNPVQESSVDSLTFTGTVLQYSLELRKVSDDPLVYEGPVTFEGSSTDLLQGSNSLQKLRLTVKNGEIEFIGIGVDENGIPAEFAFLKGGIMTDAGISGQWNIPGVMGGHWKAVKK